LSETKFCRRVVAHWFFLVWRSRVQISAVKTPVHFEIYRSFHSFLTAQAGIISSNSTKTASLDIPLRSTFTGHPITGRCRVSVAYKAVQL